MKKFIGITAVVAISLVASCSDQPAADNKPAEVTKKEVIVVPAPKAEKPKPQVVIKTEEKPTSIVVGKEGVKVETKKISIDVNPK